MGGKKLKKAIHVLGLCSYPREAAATRFRLEQFVLPMRSRGVEITISPFLDGSMFKSLYAGGGVARKAFGLVPAVARRIGELFTVGKYDLIIVQREAMLFGPAIFEWLFQKLGRMPMVLDLDDATYVRYVSPSYGRLGSFFKFFGKTDALIKRSAVVVCGNRFIAKHVGELGTKAVVIPTVVDQDRFRPVEKMNEVPVIGWIGTHSTFPFLFSIFPVLERLAKEHKFKLRIVGAGRDAIEIEGVDVENLEWSLDREIEDFQSLDIGLYPVTISDSANEQWLHGKSGFKAIQYMAVGIPFVMNPVGVCAEIGEPGKTHFNAETEEDWYNSLERLILDSSLRLRMGARGRKNSEENFGLDIQSDLLTKILRDVFENEVTTDN